MHSFQQKRAKDSRMQSMCHKNACLAFAAFAVSVLLCAMPTTSTALDTSLYEGMEQLDPTFILYWQLNLNDSSIRFAVKAKTAGYVGLGISEVGAMVGSDMMIGTVQDGYALVIDAFAYNKTSVNGLAAGVVPDSQQDIKTISGEEYVDEKGDTWTVLEFSRKLNTSDCNDRMIDEGTNQIIWSIGGSDVLAYHGDRRGGTQLAFYGEKPNTVIPPGHETFNLTVPEYKVPADYTTYTCNTFKFPFPAKRHVSSYSVLIDTNVPQAVHHVVVHSCEEPEIAGVINRTSNLLCGFDIGCARVMIMWAVGGKPVVLPDFAGLPVGPGTIARVAVMQVHYTNPSGRTDIVDRSGISLTLAPELRPVEAGIFSLGPYIASDQILIPPGMESWKMESSCSAGCTAQNIVGNITIIGSTLHQHLLGKKLWTKLYRNGTELATVGRADYYDFNFQTMVRPPKAVVVLPGDVLKTTCIWDSTGRTTVTPGGQSTEEEMCMNYVLYYPLQEALQGGCLDACISPNFDQRNFSTFFQPAFEGLGQEYQFCNDFTALAPNETCLYGPTGGQNETLLPLSGCPSSSLAALPAANKEGLQVPATTTAAPPTGSTGCTSPFGGSTISFKNCQTLGGGFSLKWNAGNGSSVTVGFSHAHDGWIAFGLSSSGQMVGSSAIVGLPSASQGVTVGNYYLGGKSSAEVKPPGQLAASSLQGEFADGEVRLLFTLVLTPDQMSKVNIIWAKGDVNAADGLSLKGHAFSDSYSGSVSFQSGATTTAKRSNLRNVHGIINALAWGILIPVGAMLARYAKAHDPAWFYAHITVQGLGFLLGLSGFITGVVLHNRSKVDHSTHLALAVIILGLSFLQVVGSLLRPKKDAKIRWAWNMYHHWAGRIVIALAIANIYVGLNLLKPGSRWVIAYSVILGLLVAAAVVLEAWKTFSAWPNYKENRASFTVSEETTEDGGEKGTKK